MVRTRGRERHVIFQLEFTDDVGAGALEPGVGGEAGVRRLAHANPQLRAIAEPSQQRLRRQRPHQAVGPAGDEAAGRAHRP